MSKRAYTLVIIIIVAMGAIALLWPQLVIETYSQVAGELDQLARPHRSNDQAVTDILKNINFDTTGSDIVDTGDNTDAHNGVNKISIPSIGVSALIIEGTTQEALLHGFWHIPGSAQPGQGNNVVISGHRWFKKPPDPETLYNIDNIKMGDEIFYEYGNKQYTYVVEGFEIVDPSAVRILEQNEDKLTLFTCHPLFSTRKRYVVTAKLKSVQ